MNPEERFAEELHQVRDGFNSIYISFLLHFDYQTSLTLSYL